MNTDFEYFKDLKFFEDFNVCNDFKNFKTDYR